MQRTYTNRTHQNRTRPVAFVLGFVAVAIATAAVVFTVSQIADSWRLGSSDAPPIWPGTGLTAAAMVGARRRFRWAALAGGLAAQVIVLGVLRDFRSQDIAILTLAIGLEILAGYLLIVLFDRRTVLLDRFRRVFVWLLLSFVMAAVGATVAAVLWRRTDVFPTWLLADAIGIFAVGELIWNFSTRGLVNRGTPGRRVELGMVVCTLVIANYLVFHVTESLSYFIIAGLLWLGARFAPPVAISAAIVSIIWASVQTSHGHGLFIVDNEPDLVLLQTFNATAIIATALTSQLAVAGAERRVWMTSLIEAIPDRLTISPLVGATNSAFSESNQQALIAQLRMAIERAGVTSPESWTHDDFDPVTGESRYLESRTVDVNDEFTLTITRDLTRETELFRQVERDKQRWRHLATTGYEGFVEVDKDGHILEISERIAAAAGQTVEAALGGKLSKIFPPQDWERFKQLATRITEGETVTFDRAYKAVDGEGRWVLTSAEPIMTKDGVFDGCLILVLDTTDLHRLNAARVESEHALTVAQESERHRLARTLHDGALQDFAAANLLVGSLRLEDSDARLERAEVLLTSGMRKLRNDAIGIDPADLGEHGIAVALDEVSERFSIPGARSFSVIDNGIGTATGREITALFRISREALVNAIVHSDADTISVELDVHNSGYRATIEDNGIGFEFARKANIPGHLGLRTMAELSTQLGGWCTNSAQVEGGTRVQVWIPFTASEATITLDSPSDSAAKVDRVS